MRAEAVDEVEPLTSWWCWTKCRSDTAPHGAQHKRS